MVLQGRRAVVKLARRTLSEGLQQVETLVDRLPAQVSAQAQVLLQPPWAVKRMDLSSAPPTERLSTESR